MSDAMCWPEQEAVWQWMKDFDIQLTFEQENALKNAVSKYRIEIQNSKQEQDEPVAWRGYNWSHSPDDWVYRDFDDPILDGNGNNVGQPLYTKPQPREWVGLTDEDIEEAYKRAEKKEPYMGAVTRKGVAEALEQILKEKNT